MPEALVDVVRAARRLLKDTERNQAIQCQALRNEIDSGKLSGAAKLQLNPALIDYRPNTP